MPYNVTPSQAPMMSSSGNWMTLAQIISGLVGGNSNPTPPTAQQNDALNAGQGPLNASAANAWSNSLMNLGGNGVTPPAPTPGYNPNQFGVPLGTQQSNSY